MTLTELKQILDTSGYPVAYSHFKEPPSLPYIVYLVSYSSNFFADNKVHRKIDNVQIELYTDKKDLNAENTLESVLDTHEIPYQTTESYIESEQLFQKLYELRLI
jgi:hypothetical protein